MSYKTYPTASGDALQGQPRLDNLELYSLCSYFIPLLFYVFLDCRS